jgi:hypothetical protein
MLFLMKHVMDQYRPLIEKTHDDAVRNTIAIECDLELIFGLHAILPLLDLRDQICIILQCICL